MTHKCTRDILIAIYRAERDNTTLQPLPNNYQAHTALFLTDTDAASINIESFSLRHDHQHDVRQLYSMATDIYNLRLRKIINIALTTSLSKNIQSITEIENKPYIQNEIEIEIKDEKKPDSKDNTTDNTILELQTIYPFHNMTGEEKRLHNKLLTTFIIAKDTMLDSLLQS